tara:strand:- start:4 stop:291 length:288 start_codon:yes stop_codon:yes gene_type:complete
MGVFSKAKKYSKSSLELEEKIKLLEKEEKKNIREVTMSTGGMYSIVEPVPEVPPVDPTPPTQIDYNKLKLRETATKHFKKPVQLKSWHKGHLTNA